MTEPKPHSHYFKPVGHLESIDVYRVIDLFEVRHPALQHALKKVIAAGKRGAKSEDQDAQEAIDSLNRFLAMRKEDADIKNEFGLWIGVPDWWMRMPEGLVGIKGIKVQVKFRNGDLSDWTSGKFFCWDNPPAHNSRIIAYRIAND